jgi:hypothetical protein
MSAIKYSFSELKEAHASFHNVWACGIFKFFLCYCIQFLILSLLFLAFLGY